MKIAILTRAPNSYSTQRLAKAAKKRGHTTKIIDTLRCYMNIAADAPTIHYNGKKITGIDAVIPRIGASITFYGTAVVRQFEMMGSFCVNESVAISRARDKLRSFQLLSRKGVGLPLTGFARDPDDINDLIKMIGGVPFIIKLVEGTQGIGVVLAETKNAAKSVMEAFYGLRVNMMIQEYIKEAEGADIRCFVIGKKVVAAMERRACEGEFRSNLHRGGKAKSIHITARERKTAIRAAHVLGLKVAGVDLLRSKRGPLVMEVNASPGLEGIERATKIDVATEIIKFIESNYKPHRAVAGKG